MSRGNWCVLIAALFGLATLCAVGGYLLAASANRQAEWYPAYTDTGANGGNASAAAPAPNARTPRNKQPCRNPQGREESDLCAQWVAANAARGNVVWTERHFWVGLLTAFGLAITVLLTLRAVRASEQSLEHTREVSYLELRAYVTLGIPTLKPIGKTWQAYFPVQNTGQTPAYGVRTKSIWVYTDFPVDNEELARHFRETAPNSGFDIGPHSQRAHRFLVELDEPRMALITAGKACVIYRIELTYSTYSGEQVALPATDWIAGAAEFEEQALTRADPACYKEEAQG